MRSIHAAGLLAFWALAPIRAENGVRPGRLVVEPPTLICLGFEWEIAGDDNRNASVEVEYRKSGETNWKKALPLLRIGGEKVHQDNTRQPFSSTNYTVPEGFAGSILDLEPSTDYDYRLTITDPDGVSGPKSQTGRVHTRGEPNAAEGGRVLHVYPTTWRGPKQQPAYTGLMSAYYQSGFADWNVVAQHTVEPGDTILVHAGLYAQSPELHRPARRAFIGAYVLTAQGTSEKPITSRGRRWRSHLRRRRQLPPLRRHGRAAPHLRRPDLPQHRSRLLGRTERSLGATGLTVRNCRIEDVGVGVNAQRAGSKDFYIADNVFLGRDDP